MDKCRFEHDPKSASKSCGADEKGKGSKGKGKSGKEAQPGGGHVQKCIRYLKGKCEKGKDCGFKHSKADPSKSDLEVQRRIAEKKAKESSGRDAAAGVVLGGDRPKVMLEPVEEPAEAETEEWIWDTSDLKGVAGSGVAADDLVSSVGFIREVGDSADGRNCRRTLSVWCITTMMLAVQKRTTMLQGVPSSP